MSNFEETFQPQLFKDAMVAANCFTPDIGILDLATLHRFHRKPRDTPRDLPLSDRETEFTDCFSLLTTIRVDLHNILPYLPLSVSLPAVGKVSRQGCIPPL